MLTPRETSYYCCCYCTAVPLLLLLPLSAHRLQTPLPSSIRPLALGSDELGIIFSIAPPNPPPAAQQHGSKAPSEGDPPPPPATTPPPAGAGCSGAAEPQFILQEHKLGVSVHSIHPLINEARAAFPAARLEYRRLRQERERRRRHEVGGEGERQGRGEERAAGGVDLDERIGAAAGRLLSATRALLLVNADHGSAWNARKELVVDGLCEGEVVSISQEMKASRSSVGCTYVRK